MAIALDLLLFLGAFGFLFFAVFAVSVCRELRKTNRSIEQIARILTTPPTAEQAAWENDPLRKHFG